jgi:DNA-binding FrmR family transcriptional regulator
MATNKKLTEAKLTQLLGDFPDHSNDLVRLKRIKGQVEGVERMIEAHRHCPDIINQIQAVVSSLLSVKNVMTERHLRHCVAGAIRANDAREMESKIKELMELIAK